MAQDDPRTEFDAAIAAARETPDNLDLWDTLESLNDDMNCPDEVAALYREVLAQDLTADAVLALGERAAAFMDEWFGDDPTAVEGVLRRVLEVDPQSESAFQRLTVVFTVTSRWDDLLALYDRALEDTGDGDADRRIRLLDEAAQVAKDVANQPDKAISYLQRLQPLRPNDSQLEHSLERLLERHERWADLIALWESRLPGLPPEERAQSRARIAACWLDNLDAPGMALEAVRPLLGERADDTEACQLLERIVTSKDARPQVRDGALDLLRRHYEKTDRPREIVRVLEAAIALAEPAESQALREEAGARLAELEDDAAAMDHYAALLALNPASSVTQEKMRAIARRSGDFVRYATGVAAAADVCADVPRKVALLAEAARTRLEMLDDESGAIDFYQAALAQEGLGPVEERRVARRLAELLDRAHRPAERLDVLERLASIETETAARRAVIGEAARLAENLGETDRALALWRGRIETDPNDMFAIDATISLLIESRRWEPLIEMLEMRARKTTSDVQRRADLVRIAHTFANHLAAPDQAIAAWQRVQTECGEDAETVDALASLYAETDNWAELAALLERASTRETRRVTDRLVRLADAYRAHLGDPDRGLGGYRAALAIDSRHEGARAGMTALLEVDSCRAAAAASLADSYRDNGDWDRFLALSEPRLADAGDPRERLRILREIADVQERRVKDRAGALASWAEALPLAPKDRVLEGQVVRLAEATGEWAVAARAFDRAAAALDDDPHEASRLRFEHARIREDRLGDDDGAHAAYLAVTGVQPGNLDAVRGVVRLGTRLGRWSDAAQATLAAAVARGRLTAELSALIADMEAAAGESGALAPLAGAMTAALEESVGTPPQLAAALYRRVAAWHMVGEADRDGAAVALSRALRLDADDPATLRALADLQRAAPDRAFYDTLRRLSELDRADLDVLFEAAQVAIDVLDSPAEVRSSLTALLGRATAAWRGTAEARGSRAPDTCASWAIERLVDHHVATGDPTAAVDLLVDATRLPFGDHTRRAMRHRAAAIATEHIRDNAVAIEMYRGIVTQTPDDTEAIERLAALYEAEGRVAEKLALRRHQLALPASADHRLDLRLEIAALVGRVVERGGRVEVLRANLADQPGHAASIDALVDLLERESRHAERIDLLEEQARALEAAGDGEGAAGLWGRAAAACETETQEHERAIRDYRRVVELSPTRDAYRALARLYVDRDQPAQAVPWFESLLPGAEPDERTQLVLQLARAHLGAKQTEMAIACLENNLRDDEPAIELRDLLAQLYRDSEAWEPLARHLTRSLPVLADQDKAIAYAREAADIYTDTLEVPNQAIPALQKALAVMPDDRAVRLRLAVGLRVAGRLDEAAQMLSALVDEFGRRRSAERAQVHVELALVAQAEGKIDEALSQMELASKMDVGNARIQKQLAELARASGKLDKAERTYRALLLVVRRQPPGGEVSAVGVSEVLFELHKLAIERGESEQATELLESAIDAAVQSDVEVRRLRRSLLSHDEPETLLRVLRMRLDKAEKRSSKAALLADIAEVLDGPLGRAGEALDAALDALANAPQREDLHDRARDLARRVGQTGRYVEVLHAFVDKLRRKEDPPKVAGLLLRAGEATELDAGDLPGALALYKRVEEMGERTAEALFAIARVTGALGDTEEQARVLDQMLQLASSDEPSAVQVNALYRLSEIFIADPERRDKGIELLERAFAAEPRYVQAGTSLKIAAEANPDDARVMQLYERVARKANDWAMLLDFLERRAERPDATPAQVREAVDVAVAHGKGERAEGLLGRAVEAARASDEGLGGAVWAAVSLAERRAEAGDLAGARDLLFEIVPFSDPAQVDDLTLRLARTATGKDPRLAAELYEFLRERNPNAREVWEPLVRLYRELGEGDALQIVIGSTLPSLVDPGERNALRMEHATYLIENLQRHQEAVEVLRDILMDDPDHLAAAQRLEDVLRDRGDEQALADFLWQRFDDARQRRNADTVLDVANRLGALLDQMQSPEAVRVYREALEIAPDSPELLRLVLSHLDPEADAHERARLMERLLAVEEGDGVAGLALELCQAYEAVGDAAGVQRALELGFRANPDDPGIRERLEAWYRERQLWEPLAQMMAQDAERLEGGAAVARLREAAAVYRDSLGDPRSAAEMLRKARGLDPSNDSLVAELAASLTAAGDVEAAIEAIGEALPDLDGAARIDLLLLRADLRVQLGREDAALQDLEEGFAIDAERVGPQLIGALDARRARASEQGDADAERDATMRLVALLGQRGETDRVRELLAQWVDRAPNDREALHALRDLEAAADSWDGVLATNARLVAIETGEAQVQAALGLAESAERAGRPGEALAGLEAVHEAQPDNEEIRDRLRRIYELSGEHRKLAQVLLADGDHADDEAVRYSAYRRAAEVLVYSLQDAAAAIEPAKKARELRPKDHEATVLFVDVLTASGHTSEAVAVLEPAIGQHKRRSPQLAVLQQRMARVAAAVGDRDTQLAWLKKSFDVDRKNGEIAAELAQLATEAGDYDLALKPLRAITLMDDPGPITRVMALLWEAKIEHARGNRAKAELWAKKALREDPAFAEAQEFLDQIAE